MWRLDPRQLTETKRVRSFHLLLSLSHPLKEVVVNWLRDYAVGSHTREWLALAIIIFTVIRVMHRLIKTCLLAPYTQTKH
jgi:hypothetical protein